MNNFLDKEGNAITCKCGADISEMNWLRNGDEVMLVCSLCHRIIITEKEEQNETKM